MKLTNEERAELKKLVLPLLDDLHRLAYYLSHSADDAEDLVAETVKKACDKFHTLRNRDRMEPWLMRILRNTYVSMCRERQRYATVDCDGDPATEDERFSLFAEVSQPFLLWWRNPERELLDKLLEQDIRKAIAELPPTYRLAVVLCDVEGLPYDEIATVLEIPIGTVRSRISRGRSILQKKLYHHAVERGIINTPRGRHEEAPT